MSWDGFLLWENNPQSCSLSRKDREGSSEKAARGRVSGRARASRDVRVWFSRGLGRTRWPGFPLDEVSRNWEAGARRQSWSERPLGKPQSPTQREPVSSRTCPIQPESPCPLRITRYRSRSLVQGQLREEHVSGLCRGSHGSHQ